MNIDNVYDIKEGDILVNGGVDYRVDRVSYVLGSNRTIIKEFLLWSYKRSDYIHPVSREHMEYFIEQDRVEYKSVYYSELAKVLYPNGHRKGDKWILR